jgi:hypothetical protein
VDEEEENEEEGGRGKEGKEGRGKSKDKGNVQASTCLFSLHGGIYADKLIKGNVQASTCSFSLHNGIYADKLAKGRGGGGGGEEAAGSNRLHSCTILHPAKLVITVLVAACTSSFVV